jgi:hypothetical protein
MSSKLDDATAKTIAAQLGVTLGDDAANAAAQSMAGLLKAADGHARALPFEAEPGSYRAAQIKGKR